MISPEFSSVDNFELLGIRSSRMMGRGESLCVCRLISSVGDSLALDVTFCSVFLSTVDCATSILYSVLSWQFSFVDDLEESGGACRLVSAIGLLSDCWLISSFHNSSALRFSFWSFLNGEPCVLSIISWLFSPDNYEEGAVDSCVGFLCGNDCAHWKLSSVLLSECSCSVTSEELGKGSCLMSLSGSLSLRWFRCSVH